MIVICPYCLENCVLNRYNSYECSTCDARVGCHKGTMIPPLEIALELQKNYLSQLSFYEFF